MKSTRSTYSIICATWVVVVIAATAGMAVAETATMSVATANGTHEFSILDGGNELHYNPQPDTPYNWYYADGSLVTYTRNGVTAPRDGMKTFAATNIAYGQRLDSLSLNLDYAYGGLDGDGLPFKGYPNINVHITDGAGTFAIWSATSGGTPFTTTYPNANPGRANWYNLSMDLTTLADDSVYGKVNESTNLGVLANGKLNQTSVAWSDIRDWTVAGFYTEQFSPTGGLGAWDDTLWGSISTPDDLSTPGVNEYASTNEYGISLFWGDTVGSMYGDGDGEIGAAAERAYGQGPKSIANVVVGVGGTNYDITFDATAPVPEPATMIALCTGLAALGRYARRRFV